jgi:hypothetical protein
MAVRIASRGAAIGAGIAFCVFPTTILATQSYWYGLGAAACTAAALWALLASGSGKNRWIWAFGAAFGAALLTRTMVLGFVPGFVAAAGIVTYPSRAGLRRAALALLFGAGLAAPVYLVNSDAIFGYLFSYGYGGRAGKFGHGGVLERLGFRLNRIFDGISAEPGRMLFVVAALGSLWWMYRNRARLLPLSDRKRAALALAAFVVLGVAALVSTTNNGVWFELPVVAVLTPLIAMGISWTPKIVRFGALAMVIGTAALELPVAWWWTDPSYRGVAPFAVSYLRSAHYEDGFAIYDPRFLPSRREDLAGAAEDWREVNDQVRSALTELTPEGEKPPSMWLSGNFQLFNTNTLALSGEVAADPVNLFVPDTAVPEDQRAEYLTPTSDGRERVFVFALHDHPLFTPDEQVADFYRQARETGWAPVRTFDLPQGGRVEFLRLPASSQG